MKKINSIDKYFDFNIKENKIIFIGDTLSILVPKYFEDRGFLVIENTIKTLGICKLRINEQYEAILMMIIMLILNKPREINTVEDDGELYYSLNYKKGDVITNNLITIKNPSLLYKLYMTFFALGKIPKFMNYESFSFLFDNDKLLGGMDLKTNHVIFEMMVAHMARDKDEPFKYYRYTKMKDDPIFVSLHSVSHGPVSSTAKLAGSYFDDALTSSMVVEHDPDSRYKLENLLRA